MKKRLVSKNLLASAIAVALSSSMLPSMAIAQGSAAAMLEEVTVTARKRSSAEAAQDIPLAINAYGSEQLDALFVQDLTDLGYTAPNVQMDEVGTFPGVQNFSIRGQGINSSIPSVDPTVGTFVDGMYMGVTYGVVMDMFDLEAVEILRGPQGLLFGRNVTGGAVSVRTALPDGEFNGKVKAAMTDHDQYTLAASVSFPVTDKLAGKVVVYRDDDKGYFDNLTKGNPSALSPVKYNPATPGSKTGVIKTEFARTAWVLDATENLELIARLETGKAEGSGAAWVSVDAQRDGKTNSVTPPSYLPLDDFKTYHDEAGLTDMKWDQAIIEANYEVAGGTLTNILGYRDTDFVSVADVDGVDTVGVFTVAGDTKQDQISNELRFASSTADSKVDYTAGLYYFQQNIYYREQRPNLAAHPSFGKAAMLGGDMDHTAYGAFASADYHFSDDLTFTGGLRYTKEEKDSRVVDSSLAVGGVCDDPTYANCKWLALPGKWDSVTPKLGLNYSLTDDAQLYAFWTKGFRSGGVNFRNARPDLITPGPTKQEEQDSYEIGLKSDLADGRVRFNAAAFYNTIKDIQRELNMPDSQVAVLQGTINAGDVTIHGLELDMVALLTENFSINASVGLTNGSYDSKNPDYIDQIGDDLPRLAPKTANLGATYDLNLGDSGFVTVRGSYAFRDRSAYTDSNVEGTYFGIQRQVNASIDYNTADDAWKVSLYGKNLLNQARYGNLTPASFGIIGPMQKGRQIGAEVEYRF